MFVYRFLRLLSYLSAKLFFHLEIKGKSLIPKTGGFVLASNHASYLDPILLGVSTGRLLNYAARDTLFRNFFFARLLRSLGVFPIRRWSADLSAIKESARRLRGNYGLVVFPEGTRSPDGEIKDFSSGFVLLADKAKVPIVPARVIGTFKAWGKKNKIFKFAKVKVIFGPPVYIGSEKRQYGRVAQEVSDKIKLLY